MVAKFAKPPVEIIAEQRNMDGKSIGVTLCQDLHVGRCTLMAQQIKGGPEWG